MTAPTPEQRAEWREQAAPNPQARRGYRERDSRILALIDALDTADAISLADLRAIRAQRERAEHAEAALDRVAALLSNLSVSYDLGGVVEEDDLRAALNGDGR